MINVTKPFLPPLSEYQAYVSGIWDRNWLTNNGPLVNELELQLKIYLKVEHLLYVSNGTIAIQLAIKALGLQGEIITTPFSYVATTSSIVWEGCKPVYVDIDPHTLNIDPTKIEAAITPQTSGILATHVYGNPCDIDAIQAIADKHGLKVIYDAAHCFGTQYKGKSVFEYGDITTTSFHATKLFHTTEGGAVFTRSAELTKQLAYLRNFGHNGPEHFETLGINAKNSEFHAAMGLCNLNYIDAILTSRKRQFELYTKWLKDKAVLLPEINDKALFNHAYFPIVFENEETLLKTQRMLNDNWIYPRRYFYPTLNSLPYLEYTELPIAESISKRVLCLPMFHELSNEEIEMIVRIIIRSLNF
ncbi:MAG: DegT/DnrJ/EryC1/StrS family aminotransferase [Chitinophagaceae bacterium]|nr:DegT/DnrJ/EryC1/StrS family aminotransferase [Chitinophagaceae bacterium]